MLSLVPTSVSSRHRWSLLSAPSFERSCRGRSPLLNIDFMTLTVADPVFRHVPYLLIRNLPSGTFTKCFEESAGEFQFVVVDRVGHVLVDPFGYIGVEILEHVRSFVDTLQGDVRV